MVREAQKMMQDPAFQTQMRQMMSSSGVKKALKETKEVMNDPEKIKEMEAAAQKALEEGNKQLEALEKARKEKEGSSENIEKAEGDDCDQKVAAKADAATNEEEDEVPDIPSLNLN